LNKQNLFPVNIFKLKRMDNSLPNDLNVLLSMLYSKLAFFDAFDAVVIK